ncbi:double-strand break repair protein AddB [Alphaproteobacteria bacterium]|nr:double-strand break repair protein AddB [Alphaproteobacteria bacterium]
MKTPLVYSVPFSVPFLESVADYLLDQRKNFPLEKWTIYLPTYQACQSLEEILFTSSQKNAVLLPKIIPLGEVDPEEIFLLSRKGEKEISKLPPVIGSHRRQILLASLISRFRYGNQDLPFQQSLVLAEKLMKIIDEMRTENIDLRSLENLIPEMGQAEHWKKIQLFLSMISGHWDAILKEELCIESVAWQKKLMDIQADLWEENKSNKNPVMVAGSLGTIPSTTRLIRAISSLKNGTIILPGLKRGKDEENLSARHPQFFLYRLLEKLDISSESVLDLSSFKKKKSKSLFLEDIFEKEESSEQEENGHVEIEWEDASDQGEEARIIGVSIRKALEEGKKKILCISPDKNLLKGVSQELEVWGLSVLPTQKEPFLVSVTGSFLHLLTLWFSEPFPLVSLAATFKHTLSFEKEPIWNLLERCVLRTGIEKISIDSFFEAINQRKKNIDSEDFEKIFTLASFLKDILRYTDEIHPLKFYLDKMEKIAQWIFESEKKIQDLFLDWAPEEASSFQEFWQDLEKSSQTIHVNPKEFPEIFLSLLKGKTLSRKDRSYNPIKLLTPLEARFVSADFRILSGLNEGVWPAETEIDSFFSPAMRRSLNLPSLEGRLGQSAHDFLSYICEGPVLITRSLRVGGAPSIPSRFLSYLRISLDQKGVFCLKSDTLKTWSKDFYKVPQKYFIDPPSPCPPLSTRPKRFSVNDISRLLNNPYEIYAKHILKLKALESFELNQDARSFGVFIHAFLHEWFSAHKNKPDDFFSDEGRHLFELYLGPLHQARFWWEKFLVIFEWMKSQPFPKNFVTEVWGNFSFSVCGEIFTLFGRADRIDWNEDGATLIDYKTGTLPSFSDIRLGKAPQMPLEALIFTKGKFQGVPSLALNSLQHWELPTRQGRGGIFPIKESPCLLAEDARKRLEELMRSFCDLKMPYLSYPKGFKGTSEFDHLSRVQEWYFQEKASKL